MMNLKYIGTVILASFSIVVNAQKEYLHQGLYTSIGYELGFLSTATENTTAPFTNVSVGNNFNNTFVISGTYKTPVRVDVELGYGISYNTLSIEGSTASNTFKVDNNNFNHSFFIGAGYVVPIKKDLDLTIGLGSAISLVKEINLSKEEGDTTDKIVVTHRATNIGNVYIVPKMSLTKFLRNKNAITIGVKYYHSANESLLEGVVQNVSNNVTLKQMEFSSQNNQVAIFLNYSFNLSKILF
ncbi:hypothetical protein [Tenacibaculum maritimum]|uniref:hypothetical protein n=1 Tax=Tenacibaculum maritimum TaxID=107401 RepID=UPI0010A39B7B|nr:hypothetical protein [Tenacibaculum maritimum]MCD9562131.1 hypothetical protein [Tenacibaculum maritimum]MCD9565650.1 hypothetical protein [Tenacibaculum maritimum]MCD9578519.1 hypothetical protein [Tenacibaculum maritimum]MCD9581119.1 hypothetical protein [Tenacibaculum maritimum]MCD9596424.1 hypothetical protein [Tenacibaculum maritimum]